MTVATTFDDWQRSGLTPGRAPYNRCSPNLEQIVAYLRRSWGGQTVGCYVSRPVVGGSAPSSHAFGAALDWRYENPGPGRRTLLDVILPWLIGNSAELGIQALHDYVGSRIWRANRSGDANGGWKAQKPGPQMGQSWAQWIHVEVNRAAWADGRTVDQRLAPTPTTEEVDMITLDFAPNTPGWIALLWTGETLAHIVDGNADAVLRRAKVQRQTVTKAELAGVIRSSRTIGNPPPGLPSDLVTAWNAAKR